MLPGWSLGSDIELTCGPDTGLIGTWNLNGHTLNVNKTINNNGNLLELEVQVARFLDFFNII